MFTGELTAVCSLQWPNQPESPPEECESTKPQKGLGRTGMSQGRARETSKMVREGTPRQG